MTQANLSQEQLERLKGILDGKTNMPLIVERNGELVIDWSVSGEFDDKVVYELDVIALLNLILSQADEIAELKAELKDDYETNQICIKERGNLQSRLSSAEKVIELAKENHETCDVSRSAICKCGFKQALTAHQQNAEEE